MKSIKINRNQQIHCISGGSFEEYYIKYCTSISLNGQDIKNIKNNTIPKKDRKLYKHIAENIGSQIILELFDYIKSEV